MEMIDNLKTRFNVLYPIEVIAVICFAVTICMVAAFSLRYYTPNTETVMFIWRHYLGPLVPSVLLVFIMLLSTNKRINFIKTLISRLRLFIAYAIIVYLHFNLKLWSQLINPNLFDSIYYKIDKQLQVLISGLQFIRNIFPAYHYKWNAYHACLFSCLSCLLYYMLF